MKIKIEMLQKRLLIAEQQKHKIDLQQAKFDFQCRSALEYLIDNYF